jgi:hypothetical protein
MTMKNRVALWLGVAVAVMLSVQAQQPQTFGTGVSLTETTRLTDLIERPAEFEGKTVRVEGSVQAVCEHMGCWMAFAVDSAPNGRTLFVKVDDGVIVFPVSAKGHRAVAQGVMQRIGGNDAEGQQAAAEQARQAGAAEAPAAWQLKATGAVVY